MSPTSPTLDEIREHFLTILDGENEYRTEDRHPAPEFLVRILTEGYIVHGMPSERFADDVFDLWERISVSSETVHRFASDIECTPRNIAGTIDRIADDAMADLDFLIRAHVGQPVPYPIAS